MYSSLIFVRSFVRFLGRGGRYFQWGDYWGITRVAAGSVTQWTVGNTKGLWNRCVEKMCWPERIFVF